LYIIASSSGWSPEDFISSFFKFKYFCFSEREFNILNFIYFFYSFITFSINSELQVSSTQRRVKAMRDNGELEYENHENPIIDFARSGVNGEKIYIQTGFVAVLCFSHNYTFYATKSKFGIQAFIICSLICISPFTLSSSISIGMLTFMQMILPLYRIEIIFCSIG
jgi:hypothetical protein